MNKKVLYSFWGYLSNRYGISAPDGNASYSPWIINSFLDNGDEVYAGPFILPSIFNDDIPDSASSGIYSIMHKSFELRIYVPLLSSSTG